MWKHNFSNGFRYLTPAVLIKMFVCTVTFTHVVVYTSPMCTEVETAPKPGQFLASAWFTAGSYSQAGIQAIFLVSLFTSLCGVYYFKLAK